MDIYIRREWGRNVSPRLEICALLIPGNFGQLVY